MGLFDEIVQLNTEISIIRTVPIFIDSIKYNKESNLIRCYYFYFDLVEPILSEITIKDYEASFLLLDLESVVIGGLFKERFESVETIQKLFDFIYEDRDLNVSTSYIFLPGPLLKKSKEDTINEGDVFRIGVGLFNLAQSNLENPKKIQKTLKKSSNLREIYYSEVETEAFKDWTINIIDKTTYDYRNISETRLKDRDLSKGK